MMQHKEGIGGGTHGNIMEGIYKSNGQHSQIDKAEMAYKKMLVKLSYMLTGCSLSGLKFLCEKKIPKKVREGIIDPIDLWEALQERGILGPDNLDFLIWMMKEGTENRTDMVQVVKEYQRDYAIMEQVGFHAGEKQLERKLPQAEGTNMAHQVSERSLSGGFCSCDMGLLTSEASTGCSSCRGEQVMDNNEAARCGRVPSGPGGEADGEADTVEAVGGSGRRTVNEVDSEAFTKKISLAESESVDSEAETKDAKCVIEFHYPSDTEQKLKAFYPRRGQVLLSESKRFLLGRGKNVKVKLNDEAISREQFDIKLVFNPSLNTNELVLTNLSKTKTVHLNNQEIGCGQQRGLSTVTTMLIENLDIIGAFKFIIKAQLPRHFKGEEFEVVFQEDNDFYEQLAVVQHPRSMIDIAGSPANQQSFVHYGPRHPAVVTCSAFLQQGPWPTVNTFQGHQYPHPQNQLPVLLSPVPNLSGAYGSPFQQSGIAIQGQFNHAVAQQATPPYHAGYSPQQHYQGSYLNYM